MGVKERQEREREAVSRAILDAARDLFVAEGYQNVSIRKIADRIEYSPAAIYSYFPSKDDIFFALAEDGFRLLFAPECPGEAAIAETSEPIDGVRAAFWHFYRFSRTHPEYFALMFVDRSVPRISQPGERFAFLSSMKERITDPHPARPSTRASCRKAPSRTRSSAFSAPRWSARRSSSSRPLRARRGSGCARPRHARGRADRSARRDSTQLLSRKHAAIRPLVREVLHRCSVIHSLPAAGVLVALASLTSACGSETHRGGRRRGSRAGGGDDRRRREPPHRTAPARDRLAARPTSRPKSAPSSPAA